MFGGVPIMVAIPPKMEAKAIGISKILGERFCVKAVLRVTGNIKASAPTLFMNADKIAMTAPMLVIWVVCLFVNGFKCRAMRSTTPELRKARLMIRTAATVTTAGCPKPVNAWDGSMISKEFSPPRILSISTSIKSAIKETISYLQRPQTKRAKVIIIIEDITIWSVDIYMTVSILLDLQ